jgi:hypothetical protein
MCGVGQCALKTGSGLAACFMRWLIARTGCNRGSAHDHSPINYEAHRDTLLVFMHVTGGYKP